MGFQRQRAIKVTRAEPPDFAVRPANANRESATQLETLIATHDLTFRYHERGEPVLRGCSMRIDAGDRLLLEGESGGGKSTLASLLTGLLAPESGLLLLGGLDRQTIGAAGWRKRVASSPQFHENHVLTGTLAFNLLMGRGWPPGEKDMAEAEKVCRALDPGDLLKRMPAGLLQMVGETGWQLSHGERSRMFMARALLQNADLVILDESFGALDPRHAPAVFANRAPPRQNPVGHRAPVSNREECRSLASQICGGAFTYRMVRPRAPLNSCANWAIVSDSGPVRS